MQSCVESANLEGATIDEDTEIDDKWRIVWEIVNQSIENRDLSDAKIAFRSSWLKQYFQPSTRKIQ